jgi:hypothetical protein
MSCISDFKLPFTLNKQTCFVCQIRQEAGAEFKEKDVYKMGVLKVLLCGHLAHDACGKIILHDVQVCLDKSRGSPAVLNATPCI